MVYIFLKTLFAGSLLFSANMCAHVFASRLDSLLMLYRVECYYAECLLGIAPLYQVVLGIGILLGLVQLLNCVFARLSVVFKESGKLFQIIGAVI